jgi:hypothetical protein
MEFKRINYEDIYEAIDLQILNSGLSKKQIAAHLYPGRNIETAKSLFSRAKSPENTDVHLWIEHLIAIGDLAGSEHIVNYFCDRWFFHRPSKRDPIAASLDKQEQVKSIVLQIEELTARMKSLTRKDG